MVTEPMTTQATLADKGQPTPDTDESDDEQCLCETHPDGPGCFEHFEL